MSHYGTDLACIHDAGFSGGQGDGGRELLRELARAGLARGVAVDLGCGSGRWAAELARAGFDVVGIDQSEEMIRLARDIAPACRFEVASLHEFDLPPCDVVTSLGECFNYCFDNPGGLARMTRLFERILNALSPGGVLIFETAGPDRFPAAIPHRGWWHGEDWVVLTEVSGNRARNILDRRITSFRRTHGGLYRRSEEVHRLRLYDPGDLKRRLAETGFRVRQLRRYSKLLLPKGTVALLALKPVTASGWPPATDRDPRRSRRR